MRQRLIYRRLVKAWLLVLILGLATCSKSPSDAEITKTIQASFYADPQVKNDNVSIDVKKGEVTLAGGVASDADRLQAYKLAVQTPGVKKVNDQMQVGTAQAAPAQAPSEATPAQATSEAAPANATPPAEQPPPQPAQETPPPPPPPRLVTVPAGTGIRVQTIDAISSKTGQPGQIYAASLAAPIVVGDTVVVSKGANVGIQVTSASQAGKIKGSSELTLALASLSYHGKTYQLASSAVQQVGQSRGKQTAKRAGLGGAIGAGIGAIAGGGKGAAIGAAVGGGGAVAYQAFTHGPEVNVPSETLLDFTLAQPVTITLPPKKSAPAPAQDQTQQ
jgi:hypothetical protein